MKYSQTMKQEPLFSLLSESQARRLIDEAETRYEQEVRTVSEMVLNRNKEIILLTGPSASGKTTTAQHLVRELQKYGKKVHRISLDNFYKGSGDLPFWEDGSPNYETVEALDLVCFDHTMHTLLETGRAEFPIHDFKKGKRKEETELVTYDQQTVLIFEGIHALNPLLSEHLKEKNILRVYVSVHSDFADESGRVLLAARQLRFLRRLLRDETHRHTDVTETLILWGYVLRGEELYIHPYRAYADVHINSAHCYEPYLYVSRGLALLQAVEDCPLQQTLIRQLTDILRQLPTLPESMIPAQSLIQEFIS